MNAVARVQLAFQMLTLLQKYNWHNAGDGVCIEARNMRQWIGVNWWSLVGNGLLPPHRRGIIGSKPIFGDLFSNFPWKPTSETLKSNYKLLHHKFVFLSVIRKIWTILISSQWVNISCVRLYTCTAEIESKSNLNKDLSFCKIDRWTSHIAYRLQSLRIKIR